MKLNKKNKIFLLAIIFSVLLSGCIEEKIIEPHTMNTSNISTDSPAFQEISNEESINLTSPSEPLLLDGENMTEFTPEFTLKSFTWIYVRDSTKNPRPIVYDENNLQNHISERRYVVYNLSIKNNGSDTYRFIFSKLCLNSGKGPSIPAFMDKISNYPIDEIRLGDISLLPGQITEGYAVYNVDSMYNKSFLLMYNSKPISLASFENSVLSIEKADLFDYSIAMEKPPYHVNDFGLSDTYDPPQPEFYTDRGGAYSLIWSNWVNRSVVEFFKRLDLKELNNIKKVNDLPFTYSTYALKVIPDNNISIHIGNPVVVTGDNNEELISAYYTKTAISDNSTFRQFSDNSAMEMNFSNATLVKIFFDNVYGWNMASRINRNNQVVVLDENRNIVFIGFHYGHFVS